MPINILMPALSPTMEEGNLAKWLVKEGDSVTSGDVLAEIETDKATMEVEAVDEGTVGKIVVPDGTAGVKVNELIAVLLEEGEDASAIDTSAPAPAAPAAAAAPEASPAPAAASTAPTAPAGPAPVAASGGRVIASPLARRIASQNGLDLAAITGTGPRGRVVKADVEAAIAGGTGKAAAAAPAKADSPAKAAPSGMSDDAVLKLFEEGSYELIKHDGMRKTIAARLTESKQTIPHFYVSVDCQLDALLKLRGELNKSAPVKDEKPVYKLSVNDMVIKALALGLRDVPDANVSWTADNMVKHMHADVGVAVSIPGGLITPIIRRAEEKPLSVISNEMKDMGKRAKERKLQPQEYQGGTTAVSNMGMMGVSNFSAVVNPPHATILAVGAGEQRPVVKDGALAIATVMTVTLSTDHRCVDGALGAQLLGAFKSYIENPMSMLV
ncbi:MAG: pyruvate dehydrogenase complex dihydrolipoamide acetyltransferase [Hyphomicrobiales bacterium]